MVPGALVRVNHLQISLANRLSTLARSICCTSQQVAQRRDLCAHFTLSAAQVSREFSDKLQLDIRLLSSARMAELAFDGLSHLNPSAKVSIRKERP
jgi:hypothetical protein